jgi:hypothetical protein
MDNNSTLSTEPATEKAPAPIYTNDPELFYSRAFKQVMWFIGVAMTIVGVIVPFVVGYLQTKNLDAKEQELQLKIERALVEQFQTQFQNELHRATDEIQRLNTVQIEAIRQAASTAEEEIKVKVDAATAIADANSSKVSTEANVAVERIKMYASVNETLYKNYTVRVQSVVDQLEDRIKRVDSHVWAVRYSTQGEKYESSGDYIAAAAQFLQSALKYLEYNDSRNSRVSLNQMNSCLNNIIKSLSSPKAGLADVSELKDAFAKLSKDHIAEIDLDVMAVQGNLNLIDKLNKIITSSK